MESVSKVTGEEVQGNASDSVMLELRKENVMVNGVKSLGEIKE